MNETQQDGAGEGNGAEPTIETLQSELEAARARADENREQFLRAAAELENTRKRASRDIEHAHRFALDRFAADLLTVRDSLELGLSASGEDDETAAGLRDGLMITLRQLDQVLERHGIELVDPAGERFDPDHHEAVATVTDPGPGPDSVTQVVQKGALLNGRLLRPARVVVGQAEKDPPDA